MANKMRRNCERKWSEVVKDVGMCQLCPSPGPLHAHHVLGRNINWIYLYDPRFGLSVCGNCHRTGNGDHVGVMLEKIKCQIPTLYMLATSCRNKANINPRQVPDYEMVYRFLCDYQRTMQNRYGSVI